MRLFVAVEPPAPVLADVAEVAERVRSVASASTAPETALRWTRRDQWHITLAFLGEVDERRLPDLNARLERAAARHEAFSLSLSGGGRFGDRALWIGVTGQREALRHLARSVAAAARHAGITVDDRTYRPHLTLARSRAGTDLRPLVSALHGWSSSSWTVTHVLLIRSRLGPTPAYEVLAAHPLAAEAASSSSATSSSIGPDADSGR